MGIQAKPYGKMKGHFKKMENEALKEKAKEVKKSKRSEKATEK